MPKCTTCGSELRLSRCPDCGRKRHSAPGPWVLYILLLMPGTFVSLHAQAVYRPLDPRLPMAFILCGFTLPVMLQLLSFLRPTDDAERWRRVYVYSGVVLVLIAVLLFLNGGLDSSPSNEVRPTVIRKAIVGARYGNQYYVTVSSWRPGRSVENLNVRSDVFERAVVGKTVVVELHKGFFGLPWIRSVLPE